MITAEIRSACARVARDSRHVSIDEARITGYAASLAGSAGSSDVGSVGRRTPTEQEEIAAYWLTLDAINFGSGWFPTLRKRPGQTGYRTISGSLSEQWSRHGAWTPEQLRGLTVEQVAAVFGQDPEHELMHLFTSSLHDLGERVDQFAILAESTDSATELVERLARWDCFADISFYRSHPVPFLKRAQIAAADLQRAGVAWFRDLSSLTMFADNLVPHVLRLDGVLRFEASLVERIEAGELLEHGSEEEVEIRACAVHAVELLVSASEHALTAAGVDEQLWNRGQERRYKARPRHRSRTTAY